MKINLPHSGGKAFLSYFYALHLLSVSSRSLITISLKTKISEAAFPREEGNENPERGFSCCLTCCWVLRPRRCSLGWTCWPHNSTAAPAGPSAPLCSGNSTHRGHQLHTLVLPALLLLERQKLGTNYLLVSVAGGVFIPCVNSLSADKQFWLVLNGLKAAFSFGGINKDKQALHMQCSSK